MVSPALVLPLELAAPVLHLGDCVAWLDSLPAESVDAIVTDTPYGLSPDGRARTWDDIGEGRRRGGFMGKAWDAACPGVTWARACLRVLKPGGHMIAIGGTRTVHRLTCAIEDAGFEIRDQIAWCYFSGYAKTKDVSQAIDALRDDTEPVRVVCRWLRARIDEHPVHTVKSIAAHFGMHSRMVDHWAARDTDSQPSLPTFEQWESLRGLLGFGSEMDEQVAHYNARKGTPEHDRPDRETSEIDSLVYREGRRMVVSAGTPITPEAEAWVGWGTGIKPAIELGVLARKPIEGTVAENVLRYGTGGLHLDACRFPNGDPAWVGPQDQPDTKRPGNQFRGHIYGDGLGGGVEGIGGGHPLGRQPANLVHFPKAPRRERERGLSADNMLCRCSSPSWRRSTAVDGLQVCERCGRWDRQPTGAAAVDRAEGSAGLRNPRAGAGRTAGAVWGIHPTVKPVALMRWLVRLVCPRGGLVIDPFLGSGTTGVAAVLEGMRFAGAELELDYHTISSNRIAHALAHPEEWDGKRKPRKARKPKPAPVLQVSLFGGRHG